MKISEQKLKNANNNAENPLAGKIIPATFVFIFIFIILLNVPVKKYILNTGSGKYHRLNCEYGVRTAPFRLKYESSLIKLKKQNYKPCSVCSPDKK